MAEEEGDLMRAWNRGLDELAAANRGDLAMGAPPVQQGEAPQPEAQPSYDQMLAQAASSAPSQAAPDMGIDR